MTAFTVENLEEIRNITKTDENGELTKEYIDNVILPLVDLSAESNIPYGSFSGGIEDWHTIYTDSTGSDFSTVYDFYNDLADEWNYLESKVVDREHLEEQVDVDVFNTVGECPTIMVEIENPETNEHYRVYVSYSVRYNYDGYEVDGEMPRDYIEIEVL